MQSHTTNDLLINGEKSLCISLYIRKPFLRYEFAPDPIWISLYMRKILFSYLSVHPIHCENWSVTGSLKDTSNWQTGNPHLYPYFQWWGKVSKDSDRHLDEHSWRRGAGGACFGLWSWKLKSTCCTHALAVASTVDCSYWDRAYTVKKKGSRVSRPQPGCHYQTLPGR